MTAQMQLSTFKTITIMKELKVKLYHFDELPTDAQRIVIDRSRNEISRLSDEDNIIDFDRTINAFGLLTHTSVDFDNYGGHTMRFTDDYAGLGQYGWNYPLFGLDNLANGLCWRYIDNNIMPYLTKGKAFIMWRDGKYKKRTSRVLLKCSADEYPLTGIYTDEAILKPLFNAYRARCEYYSYKDIMDECYDSINALWEQEHAYGLTDEYVRQELECNHDDILYYEDGTEYKGPFVDVA